MSGLCGWMIRAAPQGAEESAGILARMGSGLRGDRAQAQHAVAPGAALALNPGLAQGALFQDASLLAVLAGEPRWSVPELTALAQREGHAAALARAYRQKDLALFDALGGTFAFAILEPGRERALLAIDRMGISTLYFACISDGIVFGSTADAVRGHPVVTGALSPQGLFDFLFFYMSPAPGSVYRDQKKLMAGQYLLLEGRTASPGFYWRMPYRQETTASVEELGGQLREAVRMATDAAVSDEEPERTGAFLSGGLDSSTVVGLLCQEGRHQAKSFTIGFAVPGFDEMGYAELAARHFRARHFPLYVTAKDVAEVVPRIATAYGEPFGNSSAIPCYLCARHARENGVATMIAGDGGDELFAGNTRYVDYDIYERYNRAPSLLRKVLVEPAVRAASLVPDLALARKAQNFLRYAAIPMPDRMYARSLFGGAMAEKALDPDFLSMVDRAGPLAGIRDIFAHSASPHLVHRLMHVDLQRTLADNDLRKVSGMCDLAGVRVRYPFLDDRVVAFAATVPGDILLLKGELRGFYKHAYRGFLADGTLRKSKHGFGLPTTQWLQEYPALRAMALDSIRAFAGRGFMRREFIGDLEASLTKDGNADHASTAWDVMMLEMWLQDRKAG